MTIRSLFVGLTGLSAMGRDIDVISNNIANVNTVGFRAGRATFDDIFYETLFAGVGSSGEKGGINPQQLGTGVKAASVDTIFTQGSSQNTGRLLDMAISGKGFFVLRDGSGQEFLTRAGNFALDDKGFIVDPGTGYRLIGQVADDNGVLLENRAPSDMNVDFNRKSTAKQTQNVYAGGNFDARVGDPESDVTISNAQSSTNLLGVFDEGGLPFGLINGDVIRFETGFMGIGDPPVNIQSPINLANTDSGKGDGVIMTVTDTTTIADLQNALNRFFEKTMSDIRPGASSNIEVKYDANGGSYEITNFGINDLKGIRVGVQPRGNSLTPPEDVNQRIGSLFVNQGDPDFTKTLNVPSDSVVKTEKIRRADTASSIDLYDSKGNTQTITTGLAIDTQAPAATETTMAESLKDSQGRLLIPGGVVPPKPEFSEPVLDSATNTSVYTARQISNLVVTQGVYTFQDGNGNMVALRLSDGAISFNGKDFNAPVQADGTINTEMATTGLDVTGDSILNIPSSTNIGGGLLGDEGFTSNTTLNQIRQNIEDRINTALRQVANNIGNIIPTTSTLIGASSATSPYAPPSEIPNISVQLSADGSLTFSSKGGNLGVASTTTPAAITDLSTAAGGEDKLGLVIDLAAKTRSVRVSTVDPRGDVNNTANFFADGKVDNDFTDGGGITGFIESADPFDTDITKAFQIGNTDFGSFTVTGDPRSNPPTTNPTGIDDSGVHLVALGSGKYPNSTGLTNERFNNFEAFKPEVTAFRSLFNERGYGIAENFDGRTGIDRSTNVPVGVVARADDVKPFEINTMHQDGITRSTVHYQVIVPSDYRTLPTQTTGTLIFDSTGRFMSYGGEKDPPTITFDPDDSDPQNGGVSPISFKLDMSGITNFSADHSAQLQRQDGRAVGNLDNVSIVADGQILGHFTNGDTQTLGKILLGTVKNEGGLIQQGSAMFTVGPNSGDRIFVGATAEGGSISSGALELSNVDLAQEFTNLIVAQRAYQANTRVITTGDQILTEIVNLKR